MEQLSNLESFLGDISLFKSTLFKLLTTYVTEKIATHLKDRVHNHDGGGSGPKLTDVGATAVAPGRQAAINAVGEVWRGAKETCNLRNGVSGTSSCVANQSVLSMRVTSLVSPTSSTSEGPEGPKLQR